MRIKLVVTQFNGDVIDLGTIVPDEDEGVTREEIANLIINGNLFWYPGDKFELVYDVEESEDE